MYWKIFTQHQENFVKAFLEQRSEKEFFHQTLSYRCWHVTYSKLMFFNIFPRTGSSTLLEAGGGTDSDALELMDDKECLMNQKLGQVAGKMDTIFGSPSVHELFTKNFCESFVETWKFWEKQELLKFKFSWSRADVVFASLVSGT